MSEWIDAEVKTPKDEQSVLTTDYYYSFNEWSTPRVSVFRFCRDSKTNKIVYDENGKKDFCFMSGAYGVIATHWQPLPELPKEK